MIRLLFALLLLTTLCGVCYAQPFSAPLLLGRTSVNRTHIAFSYAGDIWTVERAGGEARRLLLRWAELRSWIGALRSVAAVAGVFGRRSLERPSAFVA